MLPEVARLFKTVGFPAAFGLVPALIPTPNVARMNIPEENQTCIQELAMESPVMKMMIDAELNKRYSVEGLLTELVSR